MHANSLLRTSTRCHRCLALSKSDNIFQVPSSVTACKVRRKYTTPASVAHPVAKPSATQNAFHVQTLHFGEDTRRNASTSSKPSMRKAPSTLEKRRTSTGSKTLKAPSEWTPIPGLKPDTQAAARKFFLKHSDPLNPPPESRPAPLSVPARKDFEQAWRYWLAVGKAYLRFYKTGVSNIWKLAKLLGWPSWKSLAPLEAYRQAETVGLPWRSSTMAMWRLRQDLTKLPIFALMLLVLGEWTPLVVLLVPGVVPSTCVFPTQLDKMILSRERKRKQRLQAHRERVIAQPKFDIPEKFDELSLPEPLLREWAIRLDGMTYGFVNRNKVQFLLARIEIDDAILKSHRGWEKLIPEEVRYAAMDRGMNVLGKSDKELRGDLEKWVRDGGWRGQEMIGGKR